jgi:CubicO group peptidase (beta-lactamase class C family)
VSIRVLLIAAVTVAITAVCSSAQTPNAPTRASLDRVFSDWSSKDGPGCSAAASQDGRTVYEAGYGSANLEADVPITPASIFHAASVSKQFTAMAVMLLAREGKLSLDADIHSYLPELPDYGQRITLRHLLTHTSGLRDQWDLLAIARGRFEEDRITEADVLDIVTRQKELNFTPGTEYLYSNTGYTLAAIIVHRVSGKTLRQFADERIFKPLGMTRTHFHDDYTMLVKGRTSAYEKEKDGWHVAIPNYDTYGATSLFTTVGDLLKWQENFRHPVVGDEALLRQMQTSAVLANGDTTGYGLGLQVGEQDGMKLVGHAGGDAGYRTYTGRYPEHALAVAVLCNASTADPVGLAAKVGGLYLKPFAKPTPAPKATANVTKQELSRFAGLYVNQTTGAPTSVTLTDAGLVIGRQNGPELLPVAANKFRIGNSEWEFAPNGDLVQRFLGSPPRHPVTLVKRDAAHPSASERAAYAGAYTSAELGATYIVAASDSGLTLRTGTNPPATFTPAYGDTFLGPFMIEFTRDQGGRLTGALVSTGRVRKVRFEKNP